MRRQKTRTDTEAVSITTGYIINIGIATVVLSTLLIGMQGTFDNIEETTASTQSGAVAEKVASEMVQADRLARVNEESEGTLTFELRDTVADSNYEVEVSQNWVNISTGSHERSLQYNVSSDVEESEFAGGGDVAIDYEYNSTTDTPEVTVVG
jgi:hypothetical protein